MTEYRTIADAAWLLGCTTENLYALARARCPKCKGNDPDTCTRCRGDGKKLPTARRYGALVVPDWILPTLEREMSVRRYPQDLPDGITIEKSTDSDLVRDGKHYIDGEGAFYVIRNSLVLGLVVNHTGRRWRWCVGARYSTNPGRETGPTCSSRNRAIKALLDHLGIE